jgi:hypothetical protein
MKQLKNQIKEISMSKNDEKVRSFNFIKKELMALFSITGYSEILETKSLFIKVFSVISLIVLFSFGMVYVDLNLKSFLANDVVTQIKIIDDETMNFPAITICLSNHSVGISFKIIPKNLSDTLRCSYDNQPILCNLNNFEYIELYDAQSTINFSCYKFNGGENAEMRVLSKIGTFSGLQIFFPNASNSDTIFYFVGENKVKPIFQEIQGVVTDLDKRRIVAVSIKKVVDKKLPMPFSNCIEDINSDTSDLVNTMIYQNITYRRKNCYDMCFLDYLRKYAISRNVSMHVANRELSFDYKGSCSTNCPLECTSTTFETSQTEYPSDFMKLNFYFYNREYTEISQVAKVSFADFVSNTGGVLGLFLDISFYHLYKIIAFIFEIVIA